MDGLVSELTELAEELDWLELLELGELEDGLELLVDDGEELEREEDGELALLTLEDGLDLLDALDTEELLEDWLLQLLDELEEALETLLEELLLVEMLELLYMLMD